MARKSAILHVDDDQIVREVIGAALETAGFAVRQEADVLDAIQSAIKDPPDLILLDLHMPGADGYEACLAFRNVEGLAKVPIIMLTAMSDEEHRQKAFACGVADFLAKPFDTAQLLAAIKKHLR